MSLYRLLFHWLTHSKLNSGDISTHMVPCSINLCRATQLKSIVIVFHSLIYAIFLLQPSVLHWVILGLRILKTLQVNNTHTDEDSWHHQIYLQTIWCRKYCSFLLLVCGEWMPASMLPNDELVKYAILSLKFLFIVANATHHFTLSSLIETDINTTILFFILCFYSNNYFKSTFCLATFQLTTPELCWEW